MKVINVTEVKVIQGKAGFYIGQYCTMVVEGKEVQSPYKRFSRFFEVQEDVKKQLDYLKKIYVTDEKIIEVLNYLNKQ